MKVLHVTNAFPDNELDIKGVFIKEQFELLKANCPNDLFDIYKISGKNKYIKCWRDIRRIKDSWDVIHCHHVLSAIPVILAGCGDKCVVSFLNDKGFNVLKIPRILSLMIEKFVHRFSKASIFKSPSFQKELRSIDKIIPNSVGYKKLPSSTERALIRKKYGIAENDFLLIFVSANDLYRNSKRFDRFLNIYRRFLKAINNNEAIDSKQNYGDTKYITLVNDKRDVALEKMSVSDVLVVTSLFEGSPNAVKEALAFGIPVVSTDVGDVRELVNNVPFCKVVNPYNDEAFVSQLKNIYLSNVNRFDVVNAFEANRPTDDKAIKSLSAVYREVCNVKF